MSAKHPPLTLPNSKIEAAFALGPEQWHWLTPGRPIMCAIQQQLSLTRLKSQGVQAGDPALLEVMECRIWKRSDSLALC